MGTNLEFFKARTEACHDIFVGWEVKTIGNLQKKCDVRGSQKCLQTAEHVFAILSPNRRQTTEFSTKGKTSGAAVSK